MKLQNNTDNGIGVIASLKCVAISLRLRSLFRVTRGISEFASASPRNRFTSSQRHFHAIGNSFAILLLLISPIKAEILNFCSFHDEFVDLSRRISGKGIIYVVLNDGEPALEASFQTKLPPNAVIDLYEDYLKSKGVKVKISKFSEATWRWSGEINKEEKSLLISYVPKRSITTIEVVSCRRDTNFLNHYPSLMRIFPELHFKKGNIILSREIFQGNNFSGLFLYSIVGSAETVLKSVMSKFIGAGWKHRIKNQSSNSSGLCMLFKNNLSATIVATREEGETSLLITISRLPKKNT